MILQPLAGGAAFAFTDLIVVSGIELLCFVPSGHSRAVPLLLTHSGIMLTRQLFNRAKPIFFG
jgi:hypothetical protein